MAPYSFAVPRYKLTIAYDGTDFCGWQKQEPYVDALHANPGALAQGGDVPAVDDCGGALKFQVQGTVQREGEDRPRVQLRTVQHVVERAVREIVREPVVLVGASRTDAGVHAAGQVAAFTCSGDTEAESEEFSTKARMGGASLAAVQPTPQTDDQHPSLRRRASSDSASLDSASVGSASPRANGWPLSRGTDRLLQAINGRLPADVLITAIEPVTPAFDPIKDCTAKAYSYTIHAARERALWDRRYAAHVRESLDAPLMHEAAQHLIGEHDFAAFAAAGHGRLTTVRTIFSCAVARTGEDRIRIDISGSGFLYNMVRIIAGTLTQAGRGRLAPADIPGIIASKERRNAGATMPPEGLRLEWVRYGA